MMLEGNEIEKYIHTYFENGLWETVYYQDGMPERILRKECNILKDLNYMYTEKFKQGSAILQRKQPICRVW